jgi:predicted acylesterase/phospholipase RssA
MRACVGRLIAGALAIALALLSSCAAPQRLAAVPPALTTQAQPRVENVRVWADGNPGLMIAWGEGSLLREQAWLARTGYRGPLPPAAYLAVSGGGDSGAFGAGLLNGWTAAGTRPSFKAVTGISTGALIAPFAFLGPDYDWALQTYNNISARSIYRRRGILAALFDDALSDAEPLRKLVASFVTPQFLKAVGAEHEKGRLLLIGTAELDSRRPVIWNMTAIAASGDPDALDLFREILVASSAIPGALPPVMIDVETGGRHYQEMHVDGGTVAQLFLYPPTVSPGALERTRERRVYIIRNARLDPEWASVDRRTLSISRRAVSSVLQWQGVGDLYMTYMISQRDGVDYNLAYIPREFNTPRMRDFDTNYMRSLYDYAYRISSAGYPWHKRPPGLQPPRAGERLY